MVSEPLPSPMTMLQARIKTNDWMIDRACEGIAAGDYSRRVEGSATLIWMLGHIAGSRRRMASVAGVTLPEASWLKEVERGSAGETTDAVTPDLIRADLAATSSALLERLAAMSDTEAAEPSPMRTPDGSGDRISVLFFFYFHETYHIGQLGLLRRQMGYDRIV